MNKIKILVGAILMVLITPLVFGQDKSQFVINTFSGKLDVLPKGNNSVVFDGRKYKYVINQAASTLAIDESQPTALNIRELKIGETYYFDAISYSKEPSKSDFKEIIFITDIKPMVEE